MTEIKKEHERDMQKKVIKYLKENLPKGESFFWKVSERFSSGIPDIVGFCRGKAFAIELKVGRNKQTELQKRTMDDMMRAGVLTAVCYSVNDVATFIEGAKLCETKI